MTKLHHGKSVLLHGRPARAPISLRNHALWSEPSLSVLGIYGSLAVYIAEWRHLRDWVEACHVDQNLLKAHIPEDIFLISS